MFPNWKGSVNRGIVTDLIKQDPWGLVCYSIRTSNIFTCTLSIFGLDGGNALGCCIYQTCFHACCANVNSQNESCIWVPSNGGSSCGFRLSSWHFCVFLSSTLVGSICHYRSKLQCVKMCMFIYKTVWKHSTVETLKLESRWLSL